jgi:hypothetical protein
VLDSFLWVDLNTVEREKWIYSCYPEKWRAVSYKVDGGKDNPRYFPGIMLN